MRQIGFDVSRETMARLESYAALLQKWNPRINLVSKSTLDQMWDRHFIDSAQIFNHAPDGIRHWVDLGSGGGFPGLVIAILAAEHQPQMQMTLVESDTRKATFLRTVIRECGLSTKVVPERIEKVPPLQADLLSARALADLPTLLGFADLHLLKSGTALFPKGVNWQKEVHAAQDQWRFSLETFTSETESGAVILRIKDIEHV